MCAQSVHGLTGSHDAFEGGEDLAVGGVGSDHGVIRLRAVQVVHSELRARHVGLQHQDVVMQASQHNLEFDEELGVGVVPAHLQAAGGDVGDVQLLCFCRGSTKWS